MGFFDFVKKGFEGAGFSSGDPLFLGSGGMDDPDYEGMFDPLGLFGGDEEEEEEPDLPVDEEDPEALAARRRTLARKGRQSTFRTGGKGVVQTATTQKPMLVREG